MIQNILFVHGPNLNKLGKRDKNHYGVLTLEEIYQKLTDTFPDIEFTFYQSNYEGEIIEIILNAIDETYDALIINPGAYTHTSIAIRDALEMVDIPKIEVHLSNLDQREAFRHVNYIKDVCEKTFMGNHIQSYIDAVQYLKSKNIVS